MPRWSSFASEFGIPVAHTMSGKGAIACIHPLSVGVFGRYSRIANELITSSDCLLAVGTKLGEIATQRFALIPASVPLIHIDISPDDIGLSAPRLGGAGGGRSLALDDLRAQLSPQRSEIHTQLTDYGVEVQDGPPAG